MPSFETSERIRKEIIESGVDDRYKIGAYEFVLNGLHFYVSKIGEHRHVSGQELSKGLLMFARKQYGPMAKSVFDFWGLSTTDDIGYVVYNMIRIGLMNKKPWDSLDDFLDVEDIPSYFESAKPEYFEIDRDFIKKVKNA
jgi:uncharacterized repeat protein (TIGR04138 family)